MKLRITFTYGYANAKDELHQHVTIVPRIGEQVYTEQRGSMTVQKVSFYYQDNEVLIYV